MYNLMSVMTLWGDALQNGVSNIGPEPIRIHLPKAYDSTASQLHIPASYTLSILDTQGS
jgi:hypothetical protein